MLQGLLCGAQSTVFQGVLTDQSHSDHNKSSRNSGWTRARRVTCCSEFNERQTPEDTKSDTLDSNPMAARERARTQFQKGYYISTSAETVQGYCTGWELATWYQVLTTHGTCTLVLRCRSKEIASANYAPAKEQKITQGDSDVTQTSSSSEEGR